MNSQTKKTLQSGVSSGLIFAVLNALFDYFGHKDFQIAKFIFLFLTFGFFMGLLTRHNLKKQIEKRNN